jgi:hypothetical protein
MAYTVIRKAKCDRCGHEYDSSNPARHEFLTDWLEISSNGIDEYEGYRQTHHLCQECRVDARAFMENDPIPPARSREDGEQMPLWERQMEDWDTLSRSQIIDRLADILYPLDEPRDHQWNGGDVCEAVAGLLREVAPWAETRQAEEPDDDTVRYCLEALWRGEDVRALCGLPLGHDGDHAVAEDSESGWAAYRQSRKQAGI